MLCVLSLQSCLSLCNAMNCSPPGSSVHGILQERILEWVAMTSSRGSSRTRNRTRVACLLRWQVGSLPLAQPGKSKLRRKTRQVSRLISQIKVSMTEEGYPQSEPRISHLQNGILKKFKGLFQRLNKTSNIICISQNRGTWHIINTYKQNMHT